MPKCNATYQSGSKKGLACTSEAKSDSKFCGRHQTQADQSNMASLSRSKPDEPTTLQLQSKYYKESFDQISTALDLDEKHQKPMDALPFYERGIEILRKAVRLQFSSQEWPAAELVHNKMVATLQGAEDRVIAIENDSNPLKMNSTSGTTNKRPTDTVDDRLQKLRGEQTKETKKTVKPKSVVSSTSTPKTSTTKPTTTRSASSLRNSAGPTTGVTKKVDDSPLAGFDKAIVDTILNEVVQNTVGVSWDDVVGMEQAKQALMEVVILPMIRPDIFSGLRSPIRGLLLFGPPGNGKTFIAKAVASQAQATFFSISASSLTSKWLGESEKLVRALFAAARFLQPSVIFIDEIDSLLSARSNNEHEASRRLKTEFLVQFDGVTSSSDDRILVMGATNRPQDLDEAARRRLVKRIYIPLPDKATRLKMIKSLLKKEASCTMTEKEIDQVASSTDGYSCADLTNLCKDAAMEPVRELGTNVANIAASKVRSIQLKDFKPAMEHIRPSVSKQTLKMFEEWNDDFGSMSL